MKLLWSHHITTYLASTEDSQDHGLFIFPDGNSENVSVVLRIASNKNKEIFKGSYKNENFIITIKDHINAIEVFKLINL